MRLTPVADQLWLVDGPNVDFFGFPYSTRMLVARLPAGLWVWSPIALDENFEQEFLDHNWKRWQARLAHFAGITAPDGKAPLDFRSSFLRRKPAREAVATIMSWAPERVIMAHGRWVDEDAPGFLERSFAWLTRGAFERQLRRQALTYLLVYEAIHRDPAWYAGARRHEGIHHGLLATEPSTRDSKLIAALESGRRPRPCEVD